MSDLHILAVVCIRNEALHIRRCLRDFISEGIDVVLIDHDSIDASVSIAREFLGRGLISIERLPWLGSFSLSQQLAAKRRIIDAAGYDWVIHADADEWLCSPQAGQTLAEAIVAADEAGSNCINFHELVFVPIEEQNFETEEYSSLMTTYYFFQPGYPRLMRAWKRSSGFDNREFGGHLLGGGERRLFPTDLLLRHYIVLSENQAKRKYLGRIMSEEDLEKGWHRNRFMITADKLRVKRAPGLRSLANPHSKDFDLSMPFTTHFWEW
jgi:glycosyltransferase involved in cell wall biosynthesis